MGHARDTHAHLHPLCGVQVRWVEDRRAEALASGGPDTVVLHMSKSIDPKVLKHSETCTELTRHVVIHLFVHPRWGISRHPEQVKGEQMNQHVTSTGTR